jgi:hypothetical protein
VSPEQVARRPLRGVNLVRRAVHEHGQAGVIDAHRLVAALARYCDWSTADALVQVALDEGEVRRVRRGRLVLREVSSR